VLFFEFINKEIKKLIKDKMPGIPEKETSKVVYQMANHDMIGKVGEDKNRVYFLVQKKANEKQIPEELSITARISITVRF